MIPFTSVPTLEELRQRRDQPVQHREQPHEHPPVVYSSGHPPEQQQGLNPHWWQPPGPGSGMSSSASDASFQWDQRPTAANPGTAVNTVEAQQQQRDAVPRKITRPPNAWILYRSKKIKEYNADLPEGAPKATQAFLSKHFAEMWKAESEEVRSVYERQAEAAREEHAMMHPDWKFVRTKNAPTPTPTPLTLNVATGANHISDAPVPRKRIRTASASPGGVSPQDLPFEVVQPSFPGSGLKFQPVSFARTHNHHLGPSQYQPALYQPIEYFPHQQSMLPGGATLQPFSNSTMYPGLQHSGMYAGLATSDPHPAPSARQDPSTGMYTFPPSSNQDRAFRAQSRSSGGPPVQQPVQQILQGSPPASSRYPEQLSYPYQLASGDPPLPSSGSGSGSGSGWASVSGSGAVDTIASLVPSTRTPDSDGGDPGHTRDAGRPRVEGGLQSTQPSNSHGSPSFMPFGLLHEGFGQNDSHAQEVTLDPSLQQSVAWSEGKQGESGTNQSSPSRIHSHNHEQSGRHLTAIPPYELPEWLLPLKDVRVKVDQQDGTPLSEFLARLAKSTDAASSRQEAGPSVPSDGIQQGQQAYIPSTATSGSTSDRDHPYYAFPSQPAT